MERELRSSEIPSKKQRQDNSKRSKGWEGAHGLAAPACWPWELPTVHLLFHPTPHPQPWVFPPRLRRHALQTEHLSWAAGTAGVSPVESVAAGAALVCPCPPIHRDVAVAPSPLLLMVRGWWCWGCPQPSVLPGPPPAIPQRCPPLLLPALINGFPIEPRFSSPPFVNLNFAR